MGNKKIKKQKTSEAEKFNCASSDVFQNAKKFILFPSKNCQWRKNFFPKSSVQWKLINSYVLNRQFWSDCRQIYTGSKHWYNFLKFIVSKTKNIEKISKNIKKHQKFIFSIFFCHPDFFGKMWQSAILFDSNCTKNVRYCSSKHGECPLEAKFFCRDLLSSNR